MMGKPRISEDPFATTEPQTRKATAAAPTNGTNSASVKPEAEKPSPESVTEPDTSKIKKAPPIPGPGTVGTVRVSVALTRDLHEQLKDEVHARYHAGVRADLSSLIRECIEAQLGE